MPRRETEREPAFVPPDHPTLSDLRLGVLLECRPDPPGVSTADGTPHPLLFPSRLKPGSKRALSETAPRGANDYLERTRNELHLNDDTLWSGGPYDHRVNPDAKQSLPEARRPDFRRQIQSRCDLLAKYNGASASLCRMKHLGNL